MILSTFCGDHKCMKKLPKGFCRVFLDWSCMADSQFRRASENFSPPTINSLFICLKILRNVQGIPVCEAMATCIFAMSLTNVVDSTGASGFVGGDFLAAITKAHPEYAIRALVRSQRVADRVQEAFSTVQPVFGDLDEAETLRKEAFDADIVISKLHGLSSHVNTIYLLNRSGRSKACGRCKSDARRSCAER